MSAGKHEGLRERKKRRTREAVRVAAFRLFTENGYPNTTIEQIAQEADVSPRTFFRYFPNKAALLIPDQLMEPIIDLFLAAPAELSPFAAYRYALEQVFGGIAGTEWGEEMARQQLLYTLPEAAGALYNEYIHTIELHHRGARRASGPPGRRSPPADHRRRHDRGDDGGAARHPDGVPTPCSREWTSSMPASR